MERSRNPTDSVEKTPKPPQLSDVPPGFSEDAAVKAEAAWKSSKYPNPPDPFNPEPVTLRDQWRFATRQFSRWHSQAWGTAVLAGLSFFALGWYIKGSNPLSSVHEDHDPAKSAANTSDKI